MEFCYLSKTDIEIEGNEPEKRALSGLNALVPVSFQNTTNYVNTKSRTVL